MNVNGLKVTKALDRKIAQAGQEGRVSVLVGYTQRYAIYVHEIRTSHHEVGRAGYLLDVMREIKAEIGRTIATALKTGKTLLQAAILGGLRLQRESQRNCPVDTGALRGSAFTRQE